MQNNDDRRSFEQKATPIRGRPRSFDREAALEAATRLFWDKGYAATSISDLTRELGIGAPSLYAAFGSKDALYAEALDHYARRYDSLVWGGFDAAATAREAAKAYLCDSASALTACSASIPRGCMVTLSAASSEGPVALGECLRTARGNIHTRLLGRFEQAVSDGEIAASVDVAALARFLQTVQAGMSILARDGASRADLAAVAEVALAGWDARVAA